jgi:hypothetical protein
MQYKQSEEMQLWNRGADNISKKYQSMLVKNKRIN